MKPHVKMVRYGLWACACDLFIVTGYTQRHAYLSWAALTK